MEVRGRMYSITDTEVKFAGTRALYEDIVHVKLPEGSNKFSFKAYKRPLLAGYGHNIPNVSIRVGNSRISTRGNRRNNSGFVGFSIAVRDDEIQLTDEILRRSIPNCDVEERPIKYSEGRANWIGLSLAFAFLAFIVSFLGYVGVISSLKDIIESVGLAVIGISLLVFVVVINIVGMITMNKSQTIKVYRPGR
ncbi:MAG: hypothetical protein R3Y60_03130 [bacterium]